MARPIRLTQTRCWVVFITIFVLLVCAWLYRETHIHWNKLPLKLEIENGAMDATGTRMSLEMERRLYRRDGVYRAPYKKERAYHLIIKTKPLELHRPGAAAAYYIRLEHAGELMLIAAGTCYAHTYKETSLALVLTIAESTADFLESSLENSPNPQ